MQTTLTAALAAVEAAWASQPGTASATEALWDALYVLETALRAVRSSGGTVCVLSRESVESFRAHKTLLDKACDTAKSGDHEAWEVDSNAADDAACRCLRLLAFDLSAVLKETP